MLALMSGCSRSSPVMNGAQPAEITGSPLAITAAAPAPTASPTAIPSPPLNILPITGIGGNVGYAQVINGMLVVAQGPGRLVLYDLTDPAHPAEVATLPIQGRVIQMAGQASDLFLLTESAIDRLDLSIPAQPVIIASLLLPARPDSLLLTGSRAWIALTDMPANQTRLLALDISRRDQFRPLADLTVPQAQAGRARLFDGLLSITRSQPGEAENIRLYRWDQTGVITPLPELAIPAFDAWIVEGKLYVTDGTFRVENGKAVVRRAFMTVYDISRPTSPKRLSRFDIRDFPPVLHRAGNLLYLGGQEGDSPGSSYWLQTFSLQDVRKPIPQISQSYPGELGSLDVASGYAYLAAGSAGLQVMSNSFVRLVDLAGMRGRAEAVQLIGELALVSSELPGEASMQATHELDLVDVANPEQPEFIRSFATSGAVSAWEDRLLLSLPQDGVLIEDISQPHNPVFLGTIPAESAVAGIQVSGGIAYLATDSGLEVWQISDPAAPQILGKVTTDLPLAGIKLTAEGLIAWGGQSGLFVFDTGNPRSPALRSFMPFPKLAPGTAWQVELAGHLALLYTQGTSGNADQPALALADLDDPAKPQIISQLDGFQVIQIKVEESLAYILGQQAKVSRFGVIGPNQAQKSLITSMGGLPLDCLPEAPLGLGIAGSKAVILSASRAATVVDVSETASPRCESLADAGLDQPAALYDMTANKDWAFVAAGLNGLQIWRLSAATPAQ
jgi:hypothetical protein